MRLHASKLDLPLPTSSPAAAVSYLLYEHSSRSLALVLDDFSALLYPSLSPTRLPAPNHTAVPPPSTAACFVRLLPSSRVLFLTAAPLAAGSSIQLRVWILLSRRGSAAAAFSPARLDFRNDRGRFSVALGLRHGHSVRLAGSVNVFVIHSVAANQIWVFAAKMAAGEEATVHLMKCAVVELSLPIYSITISMGFMLLGEVDGVRVFPLRSLIKGKLSKSRVSTIKKATASTGDLCKKNLPNGLMIPKNFIKSSLVPEVEENTDKLKTVRVTQDSSDPYSFFVFIKPAELQSCKGSKSTLSSLKAVRIHVLSEKKYLILDSAGGLHFLNFNESGGMALDLNAQSSMPFKYAHAYQLNNVMEVHFLAVLPDISSEIQYAWLSDGEYSIHLISIVDAEIADDETDKDGSKQKSTVLSAVGAIFTSEKIQDLVPISSNLCLVLCQGNMFIYGVA
ncbi:uncharacterized protein LOC141813319 isoform X2 [Curcuma longa]|uniref:uncharacterized protein LOC141813319 isoform X2 n=1 Tax=Curcuma longa TaxID=136217 RepID=UPI003D9DC81F